MKKFLFSFLLVLGFFFFNLDSSFAADTVEENTITLSESEYAEYSLSMNEKISSVTEIKKIVEDVTVIVVVFDDGSVLVIIIR